MGNTISSGVIAFIIIILTIIGITALLLYNKPKTNKISPRKKTKSPDRTVYTEEVYQKTDKYLKN